MRSRLAVALAMCGVACSSGHGRGPTPPADDPIVVRFPLARLDDRAVCDQLLARTAADYRVFVDPEPRTRRTVIVSDLHLGPGTTDARFAGIEDFFSEAAWTEFLARQSAVGPTDLVIAGDFIEFWQIATTLHVLPKRDDRVQPGTGPVLAADQTFAVTAVELVLAAHPSVFRDLGELLARGDHRVIIVAGNHDADLLWPKVQLAIARAIHPSDPGRLVFVSAAAYQHAGVYIAHGHAYDAANRFTTGHAPFGRDRDGRCRLQSSWGEIFVDQFYTEAERQIPFIDNLYPESAAILWALRADPQPQRDLGAALRFIELVRVAETKELNRNAAAAVLQGVFGTPGEHERGPESVAEVIDHLSDQLVDGDPNAESIANALLRFRTDPELAGLWQAILRAALALPDFSAALGALRSVDPDALAHLRDIAFGDPLVTAARHLLGEDPSIDVVVFGHTHQVGGSVERIEARGRRGYYANTGSWISVASVADLRARGVTWDRLSLADHAMFPSRTTAVIIEYDGGSPHKPVVSNAR
jgi:UDP-2,3-diacylglucosamine pyrophosphatase LpxH